MDLFGLSWLAVLLLPVAGAFIGWVTNKLAVWFIFHPYEPLKLPLISHSFQGVIPKRRYEIARSVGEIVEKQLLSVEDLLIQLDQLGIKRKIVDMVNDTLRVHLKEKLPGFLPASAKIYIADLLAEVVAGQLPHHINHMIKNFSDDIKSTVKISEMVESKLNSLDIKQVEDIAIKVAARELKHIEIMGGVLGFLIGVFQVGLLLICR